MSRDPGGGYIFPRLLSRGWQPVLVAMILLLAACAPLRQPTPESRDWQSHVHELQQQQSWQLQGKIGIRAQHDSGSAFLSWQQHPNAYRVVLSGALGLGKLVLDGDASGIDWVDKDDVRHHHDDPDALIRELWGWEIPLRALPYWIRGVPQPSVDVSGLQLADGTALGFVQDGWSLQFTAYRNTNGTALPGRIRAEREGVVLTVLVSRWSDPT